MKNINLLLTADSYKLSMFNQYPPNTEYVYSYVESRGCDFTDEMVMFGLQYFIKEYLQNPITLNDILEAEAFAAKHGTPFNKKGWMYILENHKGWLPVRIEALPEGTVVPVKTVLATIVNTDPECFWLTTYLETSLLRAIWYPSTCSTYSRECKKIIAKYADLTSDSPEADLPFALNDFGARGVSSYESSALGGAAHLLSFSGTDNIAGIRLLQDYYGSDVCGFSIPAMEHSTTTVFQYGNEYNAFSNMIDQYAKPGSTFACVIDSYDTMACVKNLWIDGGLLDKVKTLNSRVVLRPDSGDAVIVPVDVIKLLMDHIGYSINSKGYKVLPDHVRVIQGDGININSIEKILESLDLANISSTNIVFGMGGKLLQAHDRDTMKFAMKCSAAYVNGEWIDVFKDPITDKGKQSKKGRVISCKNSAGYVINTTIDGRSQWDGENLLELVFLDGKLIKDAKYSDIIERCKI